MLLWNRRRVVGAANLVDPANLGTVGAMAAPKAAGPEVGIPDSVIARLRFAKCARAGIDQIAQGSRFVGSAETRVRALRLSVPKLAGRRFN
jgi:hypothetical protein